MIHVFADSCFIVLIFLQFMSQDVEMYNLQKNLTMTFLKIANAYTEIFSAVKIANFIRNIMIFFVFCFFAKHRLWIK